MKIRAFALGVAFAAVSTAAMAADPVEMTSMSYSSSDFDFAGFYAGVYGGAEAAPGFSGLVGGVVGVNLEVSNDVLLGIEFQGGYNSRAGGTFDGLALGRLGFDAGDVLIYGAAGAGVIAGTGSFAFGGGVEFGVTEALSIRGEVLGTGPFTPFSVNGARGTLGLLWHM